MTKDKLNELNEYFNTLLENRNKEIAEAEEIIKKATAEREEAMVERTFAFDKQDIKTYHKAADNMRTATDTIDMYTKKLNSLNNTGVIDKSKYDEYLAIIKAEQNEYFNSILEIICTHIDELAPLKDEIHDRVVRGNELLEKLQTKVYHDPYYYSEKARGVVVRTETIYDNVGVSYMIQHMTSFQAYKKFKNIKE